MKKLYYLFFSTILLLLIVSGCSQTKENSQSGDPKQNNRGQNVELTVSAAASLQDALNEIKSNFEKKHPNINIIYNFGASGSLQLQIKQGAPVDLYFSAAEDKFDQLVADRLIENEKSNDLVGNEIVLVVPKGSKTSISSFDELTKAKKIAIGTPETVPAGMYAKESLEELTIWKDIEEKIVFAKDARQVLTYVETGNVDAGIVYKTDALISKKINIIATANKNTHSPIIYPMGILKNTLNPTEAELFYNYLQNVESMKTFEKYGFKDLKE